ncbi:hypothetical protein CU044_6621 [Streptomyces sp. L-9-10]|nr:hypothetical protein CU044_6621 [Streptomyces sp. L-9-10]
MGFTGGITGRSMPRLCSGTAASARYALRAGPAYRGAHGCSGGAGSGRQGRTAVQP